MTADPAMVEVRLLAVPLRLRARAAEYDQDLLRELALIRVSADVDDSSSVPGRLLALADEVRSTYGNAAAGPDAAMEAALDRGEAQLDVVYTVPPALTSFIHRARAALDELEEFCRDGRYLLTLAAPDDVASFRHWVFDEFERQLAGGEPVPWPQSDQVRVVAGG